MSHPARQLTLLLAALLLAAPSASAQVRVDLSVARRLYIAYEPLVATVSVRNLSGRTLELVDTPLEPWFTFQVESLDGRPVPARATDYSNPPTLLEPGRTLSRRINITPLFPIGEFGGYRIRATIHALGTHFPSPPLTVEITDGRVIHEETVGVPDGRPGAGSQRVIQLLTHRLPSSTHLYLRIKDPAAGIIHCTHRLGRVVSYLPPQILLDSNNEIHILQNTAPKAFLYSHIGLNGEIRTRKGYQAALKRPAMRLMDDNTIAIAGVLPDEPPPAPGSTPLPSLSDRPVPLPDTATDLPDDDPRPRNLLSR